MRIRKHAKISPLLYATNSQLNQGTAVQTHINCQLNQSPWDVMEELSPPENIPTPYQVNGSDGSAVNVSSRDSIEVSERELNTDSKRVDSGDFSGGDAETPAAVDQYSTVICSKTDGKSWKCRRKAAKGNSLCEHHLSMVKSYSSGQLSGKNIPAKLGRPRIKKPLEASSSSNPYEFYYYSGFGPRWGKRRGEIENNNNSRDLNQNVEQESDIETSANSQIEDDQKFDSIDEDDEVKKNGESPKKKKARKPIKARSLKSLM